MKTFPNKGQKCPRCGDPMPVTRIPLAMVTGGKEQWPKLCGCERRENEERAAVVERRKKRARFVRLNKRGYKELHQMRQRLLRDIEIIGRIID